MPTPRYPSGILEELDLRRQAGALRELRSVSSAAVDLCSNDYLGLGSIPWSAETLGSLRTVASGSKASRLVSGNTEDHEALERYLAEFYRAPTALVFSSGYEANTALVSAIGRRDDTVLYDERSHASLRDGIRLSLARSHSFKHNDLEDLKAKLERAKGDRYVVVESLYSMDGDFAPLTELTKLCAQYGANLIVDEAHSTALFGEDGRGLTVEQGIENDIFARVHTFGKAVGYRGACIVGDATLRKFIVNFARPFVYTTALDPVSLVLIKAAHERFISANRERAALVTLAHGVRELGRRFPSLTLLESTSAIHGVIVPGNDAALSAEAALLDAGYAARAIRSPTVPVGSERIRICLHSFNTIDEVEGAFSILEARSCAA